jgi:hypothetical protein
MSDQLGEAPQGNQAQWDGWSRVQGRAAAAAAGSGRSEGRFLQMLGLACGLLAGAVGVTAHRSPAGLVLSLSGFVVALQFAMYFRASTRTATPRGGHRLFVWSGGLTAGLYAVAVVLATFRLAPSAAWFWVLVAVAVAAPAVVIGRFVSARS